MVGTSVDGLVGLYLITYHFRMKYSKEFQEIEILLYKSPSDENRGKLAAMHLFARTIFYSLNENVNHSRIHDMAGGIRRG